MPPLPTQRACFKTAICCRCPSQGKGESSAASFVGPGELQGSCRPAHHAIQKRAVAGLALPSCKVMNAAAVIPDEKFAEITCGYHFHLPHVRPTTATCTTAACRCGSMGMPNHHNHRSHRDGVRLPSRPLFKVGAPADGSLGRGRNTAKSSIA